MARRGKEKGEAIFTIESYSPIYLYRKPRSRYNREVFIGVALMPFLTITLLLL